uniref:Uncharacterized protein n=1 Tax=Timema tahoe TaxID=61484 RepID=A0A7R9IGP8_9NEOP|nr:unnamed protein product [Timema tahoe]
MEEDISTSRDNHSSHTCDDPNMSEPALRVDRVKVLAHWCVASRDEERRRFSGVLPLVRCVALRGVTKRSVVSAVSAHWCVAWRDEEKRRFSGVLPLVRCVASRGVTKRSVVSAVFAHWCVASLCVA